MIKVCKRIYNICDTETRIDEFTYRAIRAGIAILSSMLV